MRLALFLILLTVSNVAPASNQHAKLVTLDDARHLLNRTGFGASPSELLNLIGKTRAQAVDSVVDGLSRETINPLPKWTRQFAPYHATRNELSKVQRREFNEAREREIRELRQWWIREMIETNSPQTEKLVLFWHNHFSTGYSSINDQAISIARQHSTLRQHAAGNFRKFLKAIIRDPAMLNYLDNNNSKKSAPNENLARELLELFTLGEGNYDESDIRNTARALTGFGFNQYSNMQFLFNPYQHDATEKVIFDQVGTFHGDDVVDLILKQPAAASFIATKFWNAMISHKAPTKKQIEGPASIFRNANYEITALYKSILLSDEFWDTANRNNLIRSPVSLTIGTIRSTGIVPVNWQTLSEELKEIGQELFEPPNVAGWPGGKAWITPSRLLNRLEWLKSFNSHCHDCSNAMMTDNSMIAMAAGGSNAADSPATLTLKMASEEFDEPVKYQVNLFADDKIVWTSGKQSLPGGRNTKRFGRAGGLNNLPWRDVYFSLPKPTHRFDTIEIEYLNDGQSQGADRNLYIDSASFKQRFYSAADGLQTNECPRRKRSTGGTMLCNGKLTLSSAESNQPTITTATADNPFSASGVYLRSVQPPHKGKRPSIKFYLTDVALGVRTWHSLSAGFHHDTITGEYHLTLLENDCWPDCFVQWPECGGKSVIQKRWSLRINSDHQQQCSYKQLGDDDKRLVDTLIILAADFYNKSADTKKLRRQKIFNHYSAWRPHMGQIDTLAKQIMQTTNPPLEIIIKPSAYQSAPAMMNTSLTATLPVAIGRTSSQYQQDLDDLRKRSNVSTISQLLLSGNNDISSDKLTDVLTHLPYQLH